MLTLKNGLKSMLRQRLKCVFFIILITLSVAFGGLGITIMQSTQNMLESSDEQYRTRVTLLEDDIELNNKMLSSKDVVGSNQMVSGIGKIENIDNTSANELSDKAMIAFQVVDISQKKMHEDGESYELCITALVTDVWSGDLREQQYILLDISEGNQASWFDMIEIGHTYFAYGSHHYAQSNYPVFTLCKPEWKGAKGVNLGELAMLEDISETKRPSNEKIWKEFAETIDYIKRMFAVKAVESAYLLDEFYLGQTELAEGTLFENEQERVCVISDRFAQANGIRLNDYLTMTFLYDSEEESVQVLWKDANECQKQTYRVCGIYRYQTELEPVIYINKTQEMNQERGKTNDIQLQVKNNKINQFVEDYQLVGKVIVEDQGYAQAILPLKDMCKKAMILTGLGIGLSVAVLLFVGRNYYNSSSLQIEILKELGCPKRDRTTYFLSGYCLVILIGALLGQVMQKYIAMPLINKLLERSTEKYALNLHYSELAGINRIEVIERVPENAVITVIYILSMLVVAVIIANYYLKEGAEKKTKAKKKVQTTWKVKSVKKHNSQLPIVLRFAWQEFCRNRKQTMVFVLVALILTGLVGTVDIVKQNREKAKSDLYNREMQGYISSIQNRSKENGSIPLEAAVMPLLNSGKDEVNAAEEYSIFLEKLLEQVYWVETDKEQRCCKASDLYREWKQSVLEEHPYISDFEMRKTLNYEYMGRSEVAQEYPDIPFHTNSYGNDWLLNKIPHMEKFIFIDTFDNVEKTVKESIRYLEGYDSSFAEKSEMICMVSEAFLSHNQLELGDMIHVVIYTAENGPRMETLDYKIIGCFDGESEEIYAPFGTLYGACFLIDIDHDYRLSAVDKMIRQKRKLVHIYFGYWQTQRLSAFQFILEDCRELDDFRARLEEIGFSEKYEVHQLRQMVQIEDGKFINELQAIEKNIEQTNMVLKLLQVTILVIVAVVSFLAIVQIEEELQLMIELGTPVRKVWMIWVLRYASAVFIGMIVAVLGYVLVASTISYHIEYRMVLIVFVEFMIMLSVSIYVLVNRIYKSMKPKKGVAKKWKKC